MSTWGEPEDLINHIVKLNFKELKEFCRAYKIKQSSGGLVKKYIMKNNIFKWAFNRDATMDEKVKMLEGENTGKIRRDFQKRQEKIEAELDVLD